MVAGGTKVRSGCYNEECRPVPKSGGRWQGETPCVCKAFMHSQTAEVIQTEKIFKEVKNKGKRDMKKELP